MQIPYELNAMFIFLIQHIEKLSLHKWWTQSVLLMRGNTNRYCYFIFRCKYYNPFNTSIKISSICAIGSQQNFKKLNAVMNYKSRRYKYIIELCRQNLLHLNHMLYLSPREKTNIWLLNMHMVALNYAKYNIVISMRYDITQQSSSNAN